MKLIYSYLIIIFLVSCSSNSTKTDNSKKDLLSDSKITDNADILGSWTMCSRSFGGYMIDANTCQTILFNDDGTGCVADFNRIKESFIWSLQNEKLSISHIIKKSSNTFSDTTFITRFSIIKDQHFLTISHYNRDCLYYLIR